MTPSSPNADYVRAHQSLFVELQDHIKLSITSAASNGRTVEDPSRAALYATDALFDQDNGRDLLCRLVAHIEASHNGSSGAES